MFSGTVRYGSMSNGSKAFNNTPVNGNGPSGALSSSGKPGTNGTSSSVSSITLVDIDEDDVRVLEATLSKVGSLADQITSSLHKLGLSASAAERAIKPIAGKAQMLNIYEQSKFSICIFDIY